MSKHPDVVSGGALVAVAIACFVATSRLPEGQGEPGSGFLPMLLSVGLVVLGLTTVVRGIASSRTPPPPRESEVDGGRASQKDAWHAVGLTLAYVILFEPLGFVLSTLAYTFGITLLFQRSRSVLLVMVPPLCTLAVYLLFRWGLGARLPGGPFG